MPEHIKARAEELRAVLIEKIVEQDEEAMSEYLDGKEIPTERLMKILRKATIDNKLVPVFTGSALKNKGVQLVLDAVVHYLPSPLDLPPVRAIDEKTGQEVELQAKDDAPFVALAFKIATDPGGWRYAF